MKRYAHLTLAFIGASIVVAGNLGSATAQSSVPSDTSQPVVIPGKAGPPDAQGAAKRTTSPAINTTVAEIMTRPGAYAGRTVTVTSEVEEVFTPWSLRLDEDQPMAGGLDNDLLVVGAEPLAAMGFDPSWKDRQVRVTGTVRVLQAEDFRREYARGVDDKLFRRYEGKPALVATSMMAVGQSPTQSPGSSGASGPDRQAVQRSDSGTDAPHRSAPGAVGLPMECLPSAVDCPITDSSGSSVTTTDSQPLGSIPPRDDTISESQYPTSPGSGSMGSGVTGSPTGPSSGPTNGIGR